MIMYPYLVRIFKDSFYKVRPEFNTKVRHSTKIRRLTFGDRLSTDITYKVTIAALARYLSSAGEDRHHRTHLAHAVDRPDFAYIKS